MQDQNVKTIEHTFVKFMTTQGGHLNWRQMYHRQKSTQKHKINAYSEKESSVVKF